MQRKIKVHTNDYSKVIKPVNDKDEAAIRETDEGKNRTVNNASSFLQRATRTGPNVQCAGIAERTVGEAFCL